MRAKQILTRGWGGSALTILTGGYYPATSAVFDTSVFVYGSVLGPNASGIVAGPAAAGSVDAPDAYGYAVGPNDRGYVKGPDETWH